jgi:hypothetical protein
MTENFTTTDIYLAGVLFAKGVRYHKLEAVAGDWKDNFVFDSPASELLAGWQNGTLEVGALAYANALRKLKRDVKQHQREKENHRG